MSQTDRQTGTERNRYRQTGRDIERQTIRERGSDGERERE